MIRPLAALIALTRAGHSYDTNSEFIENLPHSALGWVDEESGALLDDTRYWSHFYKRDGASTVSFTRSNGEYVVFSIQQDVQLEYESPSEYDYSASTVAEAPNSVVEDGRDLDKESEVDPDPYLETGDADDLSWPHVLLQVPYDAKPGETYWGSVKITSQERQEGVSDSEPLEEVVRYAAIEVTVADEQSIEYDYEIVNELMAALYDYDNEDDSKYNTNYIELDLEPEYGGYYDDEDDSSHYYYYGVEEDCEANYLSPGGWTLVDPECRIAYDVEWADAEDWATPNSQININHYTTVIFDLGEDCDIDLAPLDATGNPLNVPGENAIVTHIIEEDQSDTERDLDGYAVRIPADAPAGQSYYLSFTTTGLDRYTEAVKYWTVELINEGPVQYGDGMYLPYKYGVFTNVGAENWYADYFRDPTLHLARGTEESYLVREIHLKPSGILEMCAGGSVKATWLTAEDLPGDLTILPHSYLLSEDTEEICFAWQVPADATVGDVYTAGLVADVRGDYDNEEGQYEYDPPVKYSGHWKIVVGNTPILAENVEEFKASIPDGASSYKFQTLGEDRDGFKQDSREAKLFPVASLKLVAGQGFSTEFAMDGLQGAWKMVEQDMFDQFDVPLNREKILLTPQSEVAIKTTSVQAQALVGEANPYRGEINFLGDWVTLDGFERPGWSFESDSAVHPCFAWSVPTSAAPGDMLYAGVEIKPKFLNSYYGVFEVEVVLPPAFTYYGQPVEEEEVDGESLAGVVTVVALTVGVVAASAYLFVL